MNQIVSRPQSSMPSEHYVTYRVLAPITTHWLPATCEEIECEAFLNGFHIDVDESTELGQRQAHYIRHDTSRGAIETRLDTGLTRFTYAAGNRCFAAGSHRKQYRPDQYIVDGGDWRGNPRGTPRRVHTRVEHWVEDFAENQDRLARIVERG